MRSWWELYKKELIASSFFSLVVFLLVTAWELFLFYKIGSWPMEVTFGLSFIPFSIFPLLLLWMGYNSYRQEWKDETIYFLLSLPRTGWQLNLSKLMTGMTFYLLLPLYNLVLVYFLQQKFIKTILLETPAQLKGDWMTETLIKVFAAYWLIGFLIYIIAQFSQLVSQVYSRFRGLVSIIVFILANYVLYRGGSIFGPLFKWLPDIPVRIVNETFAGMKEFTVYVGSGPIIASTIILIGIFFAGAWLLENQLEV